MQFNYLNTEWKILVIDDSKLNRAIVKKNLAELKMTIHEAADGLEGIAALKKDKYDLILVDIIMPNMDGFGFLNEFKNIIGEEFIPVILMTGSDDLDSKIKGFAIGADDFLMKPLNTKELVARVISLLRLKNTHDELYEKNQLIKKELEIAKKVQEFIIPKNFDNFKYPKISGKYLPIEDIGGDYFDCYNISDDETGYLIADVTGHGIPAALVMTMSKMTFSMNAVKYESTKDLMESVNFQMRGLLLDSQYITAFYVIYNKTTNRIKFTNAGHNRPLYYRAAKDKILGLDTNGLFIGISDVIMYEEKSIEVQKGDRLFLYTDGITEIKNSHNEEYGESRLASFIRKNNDLQGDIFCNKLLNEVGAFTRLDKRNDDIAFISIEF